MSGGCVFVFDRTGGVDWKEKFAFKYLSVLYMYMLYKDTEYSGFLLGGGGRVFAPPPPLENFLPPPPPLGEFKVPIFLKVRLQSHRPITAVFG